MKKNSVSPAFNYGAIISDIFNTIALRYLLMICRSRMAQSSRVHLGPASELWGLANLSVSARTVLQSDAQIRMSAAFVRSCLSRHRFLSVRVVHRWFMPLHDSSHRHFVLSDLF